MPTTRLTPEELAEAKAKYQRHVDRIIPAGIALSEQSSGSQQYRVQEFDSSSFMDYRGMYPKSDYKTFCDTLLIELAIDNAVVEAHRLYAKSHPSQGSTHHSTFNPTLFLYYLNELVQTYYENLSFDSLETPMEASSSEPSLNPVLACTTLQNPKYLDKYIEFMRNKFSDPNLNVKLIPGYGLSLSSFNNFGPASGLDTLRYTNSQSQPGFIASTSFENLPFYKEFYNPVEQFLVRHNEVFRAEKAVKFSGFFKRTTITKAHTLEMIFEHGANPKSRTHGILKDLGWLNTDGTPKAELAAFKNDPSAPSYAASSSSQS